MLEHKEVEAVQQALHWVEQLYQQWMIGAGQTGSPPPMPESWQPLLAGQSTERTRVLSLALASQVQLLAGQPTVATQPALPARTLLPLLDMPCLPEALRPLFVRTLEAVQQGPGFDACCVVQLMSDRGYTAHPADWLPTGKEQELPQEYWPWCRWMADDQAHESQTPAQLSEDNWDEWFPAERLALLRSLRSQQPDQARELLSCCLSREPAEKRLALVETLAVGLGPADTEFLQSLRKDRSRKVSKCVAQLLSRLGTALTEDLCLVSAEELAEQVHRYRLEQTGPGQSQPRLKPNKLKNSKQSSLRTEQLATISLDQFAGALQLSVETLVAAWSFADNRPADNLAFVSNCATTLSDAHLTSLVTRLEQELAADPELLSLLVPVLVRLGLAERRACLLRLLRNPQTAISYFDYLQQLQSPLGSLAFADLARSHPWKDLLARIASEFTGGYLEDRQACTEIVCLGLLVPQTTAQKILATLTDLGLSPADPVLDTLKFNSQLAPCSTE